MSLGALLDSFRGVRALVVGDVMLDEYVFGRANRISPEAPVMVISQERTNSVPGGAANVAKNIVALGGTARLVGVVGEDDAGRTLGSAIGEMRGLESRLVTDPGRATTRKTRVVADHSHQVLRIDSESTRSVEGGVAAQVVDAVKGAIEGCGVVVMSDYLKGALPDAVAKEVLQAARERGVPVAVNPKPRSAALYHGCKLLSLNRAEAAELSGSEIGSREDAERSAGQIRERLGAESATVTLGAEGIVAATPVGTMSAIPPKVEVYDTAGAGDTVIAALALGLAGGDLSEALLRLAVEASARVVRHVGVAVPDEADLESIRAL
ncbi:MAG TPA: bifunctional ADP-heptose synthase [Fimbriimonadaceae bacterium]|nr:bifunctional ADP-heptose synthase [Fimbriimonadaceae bacterium]